MVHIGVIITNYFLTSWDIQAEQFWRETRLGSFCFQSKLKVHKTPLAFATHES